VAQGRAVKLLDGFPATLEGGLVFCGQDNINTDGIYPVCFKICGGCALFINFEMLTACHTRLCLRTCLSFTRASAVICWAVV
jgi:hypothetical protein